MDNGTYLEDVLKSHKLWVDTCGEKGRVANFENEEMDKISFSREDLEGAILIRVNFEEACLRKTDLRRANLRESYLKGADLIKAILIGASLYKANLAFADISGAELQGANFKYSYFRETKVCKKNYDHLIALGIDKENLILIEE
jgi:uncharacterized protein YjbI with pentapeptide repeats